MIQIYFDDNLINEDYYTSLSTSFSLFSDTFFLGSTAANVYNLSIAKEGVQSHPNIVTIKDEGVLIATLVIDKIEENDFEYTYTLIDKMINLEFKYDASEILTNRSATLLEIAQDICNKSGIELATMAFRGYNKRITWYDNTKTAREYIGYIAELNCGYAQIGKDGRLYFIKQNTPSAKTISIDDCADFKIGEKHKITRVIYELGALKYEYGDESGNTLYLNGDNVYITDQTEVEEIYNEIKGFEFYSFNTSNCPIDYNIMAGQVITFVDGENSYPTIAGYDDLTFNGDWYGGYNLDVATKKQEETQIIGTSEKIRDLSIKVDRESNKITQAIQEIDDQNRKISQVEQTVDNISQKVESVADLTSKASGNSIVTLESCMEGPLLELHIYGNNAVFDYLYPADDLYPSNDLYPYGDSRIEVHGFNGISEESTFYDVYELGVTEVLRQNDEAYDEYVLKDGRAQVIRRVNSDGTTRTEELIEDLGEFSIPLKDVENVIKIKNYTARIEVKYAVKSTYTDIFATKVEMNSSITQTAEKINLEVNKKVNNEDFTSANIMLKINGDTSEAQINADKININGTVSANGNFKVDKDGNMQANNGKFTGGNIKLIGGTLDNPMFLVTTEDGQFSAIITPNQIEIGDGDEQFSYGNGILNIGIASSGGLIQLTQGGSRSSSKFNMYVGDAYVVQGNMHALQFLYDSLESLKKNITPFNESALELLRNIDIYEYNFKSENDNDKKHIGFVIGDKYKYTKRVTGKDNTGVDNYAYTSLCVKAIQEQQEVIEQLQKEIKELKEGK